MHADAEDGDDGPHAMAVREASLATEMRDVARATRAVVTGAGALALDDDRPSTMSITLTKPPEAKLGLSFWWVASEACRAAGGRAVIKSVFADSVASQTALAPGMAVLSVNGTPVDDVLETVEMLREAHSEVEMEVQLPHADYHERHAQNLASGSSTGGLIRDVLAEIGVTGGKPILSSSAKPRKGVALTSRREVNAVSVETARGREQEEELWFSNIEVGMGLGMGLMMGGHSMYGVPSRSLSAAHLGGW
jgi:hypothetical protein